MFCIRTGRGNYDDYIVHELLALLQDCDERLTELEWHELERVHTSVI